MKYLLQNLFLLGLISGLSLVMGQAVHAAEDEPQDAQPAQEAPKDAEEEVDVSGLAEKYWRPQKDELEAVQNRRFPKANRIELGVMYGFFQTHEYTDSSSVGAYLTYNFSEYWALEASYMNISNTESDFLKSVQSQFGFTPDFNTEKSMAFGVVTFTPLYAKYALLGRKISHFETYISLGAGYTETTENRFTKVAAIGERFYLWEGLVLRIEWKRTWYTDEVAVSSGAGSVANGGTGFVEDDISRNNFIIGLGWLF